MRSKLASNIGTKSVPLAMAVTILTASLTWVNASSALAAPAQGAPTSTIAEEAKDTPCALQTTVRITLDGDPKTYSFDASNGSLKPYSAPTQADCAQPTEDQERAIAAGIPVNPARTTAVTAAVARTPLGSQQFTSGNTLFTKSDTNGRFEAQSSFTKQLPVAFTYTVSAGLRAIAAGDAKATASRQPKDCTYYKVQAPSYGFHWSCPAHTPSQSYSLFGDIAFPIKVGRDTGTAEISYSFNYTVRLV